MSIPPSRSHKLAPILWFLCLVFAASWAVQWFQLKSGVRFDPASPVYTPTPWLLLTMWVPGLAALGVTAWTERGSLRRMADSLSLRTGPAGPYYLTALLVPIVFAVIHGLNWAVGFSAPDPGLHALNQTSAEPHDLTSLFTVMLPASMLIGPAIQYVFALGEELGWRGFLLPRLMVLGKPMAYLVLGVAWGLWHAPLILAGFNYPGHPLAGLGMMCAMTSALGLFINEMTLGSRSVFLAAFIHAAVNAQVQGVWMWLFPQANPLLGGSFGLIAVLVWLGVGVLTVRLMARSRAREQGSRIPL
ncbi:MAG: CPBP family intramembrane metalloprotease [Pseudodesulfovibrio sp.]|uniref:Abortive infection protein n=1 Tax=Pseudodesulfovibrio aespoeensis (strain ATCC 700646 / DSM 10631 / Aspo-2) TaxID=643562 RepID=E6VW47_PSEA9|nr:MULTISPECIES: CPBP family intramembrane glutamic endopeptidase [Pseudodesulfovibrio]MBU4191672.1 CPBP family intramembrane metalloprotease [Pseudomonadota bacterium]ADU63607.1 Abortive infection protein [Pseudodesulfovibrio aespoeensis Aspo-2]MBU4243222.1 CPBP family intramembrane metalloprotease [Pseudomonadota bacterium]MBU4379968.1 CPBP family intramembrane metalloprotease [Pseudomonadota bacterium]MBU4475491.1 CPBP family intramembrane metalloprotease [Pseudomonadota bacterium]